MDAYTIVDEMPFGYRWAVEDEAELWYVRPERFVQVRVGGTDEEPSTDMAIQWDCFIEFGPDHDHDSAGCENAMAAVTDWPVTNEERRAMGDDLLYPTYDLFGNWEN